MYVFAECLRLMASLYVHVYKGSSEQNGQGRVHRKFYLHIKNTLLHMLRQIYFPLKKKIHGFATFPRRE